MGKKKAGRGRPKGTGTGIRAVKPTHAPFPKLVELAMDDLYEKGGISKVAIVKHIMNENPECSDKAKVGKSVKTALKRLVAQGDLEAPNGAVGKFKRIGEAGPRGRPKKRSFARRKTQKRI